jgi:hypothetical protein
MSRRLKTSTGLAAVAAGMLISAAGAHAATIGSDLQPAPNGVGFGCGIAVPNCTVVQPFIPGNPNAMKAPFDGTVRKWRFRKGVGGNGEVYSIRLRVVRKARHGKWKFVGHSKKETVGSGPGIYLFHTHVSIRKGDYIGMNLTDSPSDIGYSPPASPFPYDEQWYPAPADGTKSKPDFAHNSDPEWLWNATEKH